MTIVAIIIIGVCIVGVLLLLLSLFLGSGKGDDASYLNRGTRFFLVALRLVIGWHFLVEGMQKLEDPYWSSAPYLHASTGPLGKYFREIADEPFFAKLDANAACCRELSKLTAGEVGKIGSDFAPGALTASTGLYPGNIASLPPALDRHWERYLQKFTKEMILDEGVSTGPTTEKEKAARQAQQKLLLARARIKLDQAKAKTLLWLTTPQPVERPSPYLNRPDVLTVRERINNYKDLMDEVEQIAANNVAAFGEGATKKLADVWNEAQQVYASLKLDLKNQEAEMRKDLQSIFDDPVKKRLAPPKMPPPEFTGKPLHWADRVIPWALCIIGAGLLIGLLTRTNCFLGAALLLAFYLAMPPLPGWPANPRAEGHYLFINKNVIEMFALLALATTASGRWLGIDGLLRVIWPFRRKSKTGA